MYGIIFTSNTLDVLIWTRNVAFQLILSAILSVDTFFVVSGFLTSILFVRKVEKEGKLSFYLMFLYYLHRYIRLTPTCLLIVMISINLTPYFGNGPIYPSQQGFETNGCRRKYWWTSILYLGNIVQSDDMCLSISWYLYNDMQFHWIAPLSLIPFVLGRKSIAFIISILFILVGIGTIAGLFIQDPHLFETAGFTVGPEVDQVSKN
jgi:peptidoglycan/LPS O-acetylase OafA/YrhL